MKTLSCRVQNRWENINTLCHSKISRRQLQWLKLWIRVTLKRTWRQGRKTIVTAYLVSQLVEELEPLKSYKALLRDLRLVNKLHLWTRSQKGHFSRAAIIPNRISRCSLTAVEGLLKICLAFLCIIRPLTWEIKTISRALSILALILTRQGRQAPRLRWAESKSLLWTRAQSL